MCMAGSPKREGEVVRQGRMCERQLAAQMDGLPAHQSTLKRIRSISGRDGERHVVLIESEATLTVRLITAE